MYVSSYDLDGAELTLHRAVPNTYGYELPQTGGVSALPFYLCGAALFGLAIRLLILALRRARHVRTCLLDFFVWWGIMRTEDTAASGWL